MAIRLLAHIQPEVNTLPMALLRKKEVEAANFRSLK
jgi:hypothetical protein